jgi:hypothetical protein
VNQTRTKAAGKGAKVKSKGRRPPVKVKSGPELPLLPIAAGGILVVLAVVLIIIAVVNGNTKPVQASAAGIPCDALQGSQVHYHVAVQIVYDGIVHPLPANIGIVNPTNPSCYYWLHVHPADTNVIHIESPKNRAFTLGDFFAIWTKWGGTPELLDATHVSTLTLTPDQKLVIYVDKQDDKKGPQLYTGDPSKIPLVQGHEVITLEITPPAVTPPPAFTFPAGL